MRPRFMQIVVLAVALLITACAYPRTASCNTSNMYAAAPAIDEVPVFQAIRDSVTELQTDRKSVV